MSDYLNNIVARTLNLADAVQPRLPQLFEHSTAVVPVETVHDAPEFGEVASRETTDVPSRPTVPTPIVATEDPFERIADAPVPNSILSFESVQPQLEENSNAALQTQPAITFKSKLERPSATGFQAQDAASVQPESSGSTVEEQTTLAIRKPARVTPIVRPQKISPDMSTAVPRNQPAEVQSPTIKITIGRVDVRAIMPAALPAPITSTRPKPALSLETYLKQRGEGKR